MPRTSDLKRVLTRQTLRQLAGSKSFERGEDYFAAGQVLSLVEHAGKLTATVQGTGEYAFHLLAAFQATPFEEIMNSPRAGTRFQSSKDIIIDFSFFDLKKQNVAGLAVQAQDVADVNNSRCICPNGNFEWVSVKLFQDRDDTVWIFESVFILLPSAFARSVGCVAVP